MSDREQPSGTPPPVNVEAAPVNRGLGADISTAQPHMNETPTLAWNSVGGAPRTLVGQTFGDFELTEELGRGGMGVVFKAYQKSLDRHVALKLLRGEHSSNPMLLKRFLEESRAAARLSHPNIVSVYQVGECFAGPFFVMEFIDGPSLEMFLKRKLPISSTVALLIKVAEAVQHAHEKGIIHRDLKPGNIMLHQSKRPDASSAAARAAWLR